MARRITHKRHDEKERIIALRIEGWENRTMLEIWNIIAIGREEFYTLENNKRATVCAREKNDIRYLTTSPDGVTPNNLDELPKF